MPSFAPRSAALANLGGAKWKFTFMTKQRIAAGEDIIPLTIGEPEVPPAEGLAEALKASLDGGNVGYTNGQGQLKLRQTIAARYAGRTGRDISPEQVLVTFGTQNALYLALQTVAGEGDEVLVTDPLYATYEGVVRASGASPVAVPLQPEMNFHLQATDLEKKITPRTKALLLNSPHNPTGAVLTVDEIRALGALAIKHDFWILADEVYEELVFDGVPFASAFDQPELADRVAVFSSLSKSHAAAGYRAGWLIASQAFAKAALPLTEAELFGTPAFIQDAMTAALEKGPSATAAAMRVNYARRAARVFEALDGKGGLKVSKPEAGMFVLLDARGRGQSSEDFAQQLLDGGVGVMPGTSFGEGLEGFVRVSLTVSDEVLHAAIGRIYQLL